MVAQRVDLDVGASSIWLKGNVRASFSLLMSENSHVRRATRICWPSLIEHHCRVQRKPSFMMRDNG